MTERTGNVISTKKEEGITPNVVLDLLEKMQIGFDEVGNPIMPVMVVSPEEYEKIKAKQKEWESDPKHRRKT